MLSIAPFPRFTRRPRKVVREMPYPTALERTYVKALRAVAKAAADAVRSTVLVGLAGAVSGSQAPRADDLGDDIARMLASAKAALALTAEQAERMAVEMVARVGARHAVKFAETYDGVLAISPLAGAEPWLLEQQRLAIAENARLIKSIPEKLLTEVDGIIQRGALAGVRAEDMRAEIVARFGVSESRATLIARDQVNKWHGSLNRLRQLDAGVVEYDWITSRDERVRPAHAARQGKRFKWSDPPSDGHPGSAIRCRCTARPVLPDEG